MMSATPQSLRIGFPVYLAKGEHRRETDHNSLQSRAHFSSWESAHIASREEQKVYPATSAKCSHEDVARYPPNPTPHRGIACYPT